MPSPRSRLRLRRGLGSAGLISCVLLLGTAPTGSARGGPGSAGGAHGGPGSAGSARGGPRSTPPPTVSVPAPPPVTIPPVPRHGGPTPTLPPVGRHGGPTPTFPPVGRHGGPTPTLPPVAVTTPAPAPTTTAPRPTRGAPTPDPPSHHGPSSESPTEKKVSKAPVKPVKVPKVVLPTPSLPPTLPPNHPPVAVATAAPVSPGVSPVNTTPVTTTSAPVRPRAPRPSTVGSQPHSRATRPRTRGVSAAVRSGAAATTGPGATLVSALTPSGSTFASLNTGATRATGAGRASASPARGDGAGSLRSSSPPAAHHASSLPTLIRNLVPLPVPDWSKPIILSLLALCGLLALRGWRTALRARRLESEGHELSADLESMQAALVPEIPSRLGGLDVSVAYRPADGPAAGGDFYDAFALDAGRVAIILGDVSGHGRHALARAAHMRYTLRAYVETGLDPRAALKLAGRVVGVEGDGLFTTVAIAVYDPDSASLTYASAGHPPPLLAGPGAREPLAASASPAIGWGAPTGRRQTMVPFSAGAQACFFSDGVIEARVQDELLGRDGLTDLFVGAGPEPSARRLLDRRPGASPGNSR